MKRLWMCLLFAACGVPTLPPPDLDAGQPDAGTVSDAGVVPDAGSPEPCHLTPQVAIEEVGEGGAFEIPVASEPGATLALTQAGGPWELALANGVLKGVVPYGPRGLNTFGIQVSCRGQTIEETVAVKVRAITWGAGITWTTGPSGREHPLMWIDPRVPTKLWLYGGFTFVPAQFTVSNDLWVFDLVARIWTKQTNMTGTPPQIAGGRAAIGAAPGQLWLVGGEGPGHAVTSTVATLDTAGAMPAFADVPADPNAPKVTLGALVYDAPRDRLVSACGFAGNSVHCEVRARPVGGTDPKWEVVQTQGAPPTGRYGFFHAHDAKNQRLVLFSGAAWPLPGNSVNAQQDTWALELDQTPPRWVKLAEPRPDVVGRRNGCSAFDPVNERLFVWSGTADGLNAVPSLHVLDLRKGKEKWTTLYIEGAPTPRGSCSATYDAVRRQVLFGFGNDLSGPMVDLQPLEL